MPDSSRTTFWQRLPRLPETAPALAAVLWLLAGILPVLLVQAAGLSPITAAAAALSVAGGLFLLTPPERRRLALFLPAGLLLALLHLWAPWQSYRGHLPRTDCGAEIEGVVTEPAFAAEALPALAPPPDVRISLGRIRFGPDQPWIPCSGDVILRRFAPKGQVAPATPLPYGARFRATGAFVMPGPPAFPGAFDYALYLRTLGIRHEFLAAAPEETLAGPTGWRRLTSACYALRDRAIARIAAGLAAEDSPDAKERVQLLAAVIFNYRAGMPPEMRTQFIRSGTIHIFSVGGIHVVILGGLMLLLLKLARVPFRARHAALPLLLGLYVVMTGAAPPAVRAWVMISFWAVARGWSFPASSLNTIAAAALALLLANPLQAAQVGFIFSFTLVFFLITGWEAAARWQAAMLEKDRWRPMSCRPWWRGHWRRLLGLLSGTLLGWFASAGLVAWFNARLIPASFWVNVGIGVTTWCVLALSLLKLLLGWSCALADAALAAPLRWALDATRLLAELGSQAPGSLAIPQPPLWSILLFYAALLAALSVRLNPRLRRTAGALALGLPVAWFCAGSLRTPQMAVFSGDGSDAPAVVLERPRLPPLVVNTGNLRQAGALAQWLTLRGHDEMDTLALASPDGSKAAAALLGAVSARTVVQAAPGTGPGWPDLRLGAVADGSGWRLLKPAGTDGGVPPLSFPEITLEGSTDDRRATVAEAVPEQPLRLALLRRPLGGADLRLEDADGRIRAELHLPLSEKPVFVRLPL